MRFLPSGDGAVVVEFGQTIDPAIGARVTRLAAAIQARGIEGVTELVPSFRSLLVCYDPLATCQARLIDDIEALAARDPAPAESSRRWTLPVCYAPEWALDLAEVAESCDLTQEEVVRRHSGTTYRVYMLGFLPGFAYLGDLDPALRLPRRASPRTRLPAGAVAIAQAMTAVYPVDSPGGWHLIGSTPVTLFDVAAEPPALLAPGDEVRFRPVSRDDRQVILDAIAAGSFRLEPEGLFPGSRRDPPETRS